MLKKRTFSTLFIFLIIFSSSIYSQDYINSVIKFSQVLEWVNSYYVDTISHEDLVENAIIEMLHDLDPHSAYISKEEVAEMNEPLQGNFEGIGITFNILKDTIFVINPISGGPSEKVGISAGDRIVEIEGKNVAGIGITNTDVISQLRGDKGTKVNVSIQRKNVKKLLHFTITRDKIPIYSLDAAYMVNDSVGYIKLNRFAFTTMDEFHEAATKLKELNAKHLILDLGGNGGGYLDVSVKLADEFLSGSKLIVYTEGMQSPKREHYSSSRGMFEDGNVVVIIDEGSASASEIVSGAIQDWDRGVIVGRRSFGKGLVQRPFNLNDGSMIRLTIARYYTPTGRLIQKPYEDGYKEYTNDLINRYNSGELSNADSIHFPESEKFKTKLSGRTVYGGGGILPDYFVPIDTTKANDYYREIISQGILNRFVLEYVDNHRNKISKTYTKFEDYKNGFNIDDDILIELVEYAENEDLPRNDEQLEASKQRISLLLKAYIARDIWTTSEFYEIINLEDDSFIKAVEVITNSKLYNTKLEQQ